MIFTTSGDFVRETGNLLKDVAAPIYKAGVGAAFEMASSLGGSSYDENGKTRSFYMLHINAIVNDAQKRGILDIILMGNEETLSSLKSEYVIRGNSTVSKMLGAELKGKLAAFSEYLDINCEKYEREREKEREIEREREREREREEREERERERQREREREREEREEREREREREREEREREREREREEREREREREREERERERVIERHNSEFDKYVSSMKLDLLAMTFEEKTKVREIYDRTLNVKISNVGLKGYSGGHL
jgi:hypothetical protein